MSAPEPGSDAWLDLVVEDVVEPDLPIVDPHHHLWRPGMGLPYSIAELHRDAASGHRIEQTVFVECHSSYDRDAPPELAPVGETRFIAEVVREDPDPIIAGLVAHADLRLPNLDDVLDAHETAGEGLFRGIRDAISRAEHPEVLRIPGSAPAGLHADPAFRAGVGRLGERGLTYDCWHYHFQNQQFLELARAVPGTTMVLDHFGTPTLVGPYVSQRDEIIERWRADIAEIARCENVVAKLGGLAMPDNGFGWDRAERPPTSDEIVAAQADFYLHTIECFGPERCMFESNFPVDRWSVSYRTIWNAFKKLSARFTADERTAMFSGTARRVYRLP